METPVHRPVMVAEVLRYLVTDRNGQYVDCTFGGGGHSAAILEVLGSEGGVLGLDRDPATMPAAHSLLTQYGDRLTLLAADYRRLGAILSEQGRRRISGVLFDLGLSSLQLADESRGFAYRAGGDLDMRFGEDVSATAADLIARSSEDELTRIFHAYGEERRGRLVARAIVRARERRPIRTTTQLCELISIAVGRVSSPTMGRVCARVFQALRIAVNDELAAIAPGVSAALDALLPGGRVVVIGYQSLEDRIIKDLFRERSRACSCPRAFPECVCGAIGDVELLTKKPERPTESEVDANPRAASARLRAVEKRDVARDFAHREVALPKERG